MTKTYTVIKKEDVSGMIIVELEEVTNSSLTLSRQHMSIQG